MTDLFKVYMPKNLDTNRIVEILHSGKLTSGTFVKKFEEAISEYIGNPYVMVTSNNNLASIIALASCDIQNGDEIIASPMACLASNQPILNFGAKVVWADIDPNTGSLNPADVEKKITSKTKAIIHYHWGGYPGYVDEINNIGSKYGVLVIDDAIESFGSLYKGKMMGNLGTDITTFSFQTVRLPNSIDGGAISFKSKELFDKAKLLRDFGINRSTFRDSLGEISSSSDISGTGYNAIMNELNAFIGTEILADTKDLINVQRNNAKEWDSVFLHNNQVRSLNRTDIEPNYWIYSILSDKQMSDLNNFRSSGFYASKVHLRNDFYSCFGEFDATLEGVNEFAKRHLSIPCGWWVNNIKI